MYQRDMPQQQQIYQYVQRLTKMPSDEAIHRFYLLVWNANIPDDKESLDALRDMTSSPNFCDHHLETINRCYYTIVNPWHLDASRHEDIRRLILWPEKNMSSSRGNGKSVRQIRDSLREYRDSDYYKVLRRHNKLLANNGEQSFRRENLGDCLIDYPMLYVAGTQTADIENAAEDLSLGLKTKRDQKILDLRHQLKSYIKLKDQPQRESRNPTGLLCTDLNQAIGWYHPGRDNSSQYCVRAFHSQSYTARTLGEYKRRFYQMVIQPVLNQHFSDMSSKSQSKKRWYSRIFKDILACPEEDGMPVARMSVVHMFRRILMTIIREGHDSSREFSFSYLLRDAGSNLITNILMSLVLACQMARYDLEKRLSYIFGLYEHCKVQSISWFINAMEHMNVAIALNARALGYYTGTGYHRITDLDSIG